MLQNELDTGLLELREKDLTGMLDQRHHQLQRPRHIRDDLIVALREALDVEVGLEGLHMVDEQLGPDLGKEEGGGKASHDTMGLAGGRLLLGPFLRL